MIQVCGERVLSENKMKRKILSDQKKTRSKRRKGSRENAQERNAKENEKDIRKNANI